MTARVVVLGLLLFVALLLQAVVAPALSVGGWRPDLVLVTVVALAMADGPGTGARYGFVAGLSSDLLTGGTQLVGISALVFLLVGDALGRMRQYMVGTGTVGELAMGAVGGAVGFGLTGALSLLLDLQQFTPVLLLQGLIATSVWSALLTPLLSRPLRSLSRRYPVADNGVTAAAATPRV